MICGRERNLDYSNPVFDITVALSHVDGDRELLSELVIMFLDDYPRTLDQAQNSILNRDHACLERVAHTLKGRLAFFGIRKAHQQVSELEAMGREKNLAGAWKTLEEIKAAMEEVLTELQSFSQGQSA